MKKAWLSIVVGIAATLMLIISVPVQSQEDIVLVQDEGYTRTVRPDPRFVHDEHNELAEIEDCNVCHHVWQDGELVEDESSEDQACSECHLAADATNTLSLTRRYHQQCKSCHQEKKKGPVMCADCHRKQPL